jgi:nucleoside-diphosphate-sugar epimerase
MVQLLKPVAGMVQADLEEAGSFDEAMAGCKYAILAASPVRLSPEKGREKELLIVPAVRGVENVVASIERAGTVERVVFTSSVSASILARLCLHHAPL